MGWPCVFGHAGFLEARCAQNADERQSSLVDVHIAPPVRPRGRLVHIARLALVVEVGLAVSHIARLALVVEVAVLGVARQRLALVVEVALLGVARSQLVVSAEAVLAVVEHP